MLSASLLWYYSCIYYSCIYYNFLNTTRNQYKYQLTISVLTLRDTTENESVKLPIGSFYGIIGAKVRFTIVMCLGM